MNIKEKLIEQLVVLEEIQKIAIKNGDIKVAALISETILIYIIRIDNMTEDEGDNVCPECQETKLQEMLIADIENASDTLIGIVKNSYQYQNSCKCERNILTANPSDLF